MLSLSELLNQHAGKEVVAYYYGGGMMHLMWGFGTPDEDFLIVDDDEVCAKLGSHVYRNIRSRTNAAYRCKFNLPT
jgi:hypothetical protein